MVDSNGSDEYDAMTSSFKVDHYRFVAWGSDSSGALQQGLAAYPDYWI
jgi:hypothetical protein